MIAHQKIIRDKRAKEEAGEHLFGAYWENINTDISNAIVKEISVNEAKVIILEYEWLGCMPAISTHCYGIFYNNHCGGVVVYGTEYTENLGVWDKYNYTGKIILLSRGACVHWTHPHSASKLIRQSMKLLPPQYEVITATVDILAGEIGTIYQACGFFFVGSMREAKGLNPNRLGVLVNGKLYGSRAIRQKLGTQKKEEILKKWPNAEFVTQVSKSRYFAFRGTSKIKKNHYKAIEHLIKPYPVRNKYQEGYATTK